MPNMHKDALIDIWAHPERHDHHSCVGLMRCCVIDGVLDVGLMEAHPVLILDKASDRSRCDTDEGPCSCGEYH